MARTTLRKLKNTSTKLKEHKDQGALDLFNTLGDHGKDVYKKYKSQITAEETKQGKQDILPTFREIRKLKEQGKTEEALNKYNALDDKQKKYYQLLKKQLKLKEKSGKG